MTKQKYPGFERCMSLMRKSDPQLQEDGFNWLASRSEENIAELIVEFGREKDQALKCWLLELIATSNSSQAFDVLKAHLKSDNESLKALAILGLKNLDTKQARHELFKIDQISCK